jgi:pantetheine-phosphate adenylyltransferase
VRRVGRVVLGGTFDRFHAGHEALLRTAFEVGREVAIGLTSERYLRGHPKPLGGRIASERSRRAALVRWLAPRYPRSRWSIVPIDDRLGGAAGDGVDALVVSADTVDGGRAVNAERRRRGRAPVPLVVVPLVLADDLEPLSSRRIRAGTVDREGRRIGPIPVGVRVAADTDRGAVVRAVRAAFPRGRVTGTSARGPGRRSAGSLGALAARARPAQGLGVAVGPRGPSGWPVAIQGAHARLGPRRVRGRTPADLERGLSAWLRPPRAPAPTRRARRPGS